MIFIKCSQSGHPGTDRGYVAEFMDGHGYTSKTKLFTKGSLETRIENLQVQNISCEVEEMALYYLNVAIRVGGE